MILQAIALLSLIFCQAGDLEKAKNDFRKGVASLAEFDVTDAAARLAKCDSKDATDTLLDGYGMTAGQLKQLWAEKMKWVREADANSDIEWESTEQGSRPSASCTTKFKKLLEAQSKGREVETNIRHVEAIKRIIVGALASFKADASVRELIAKLKGDSNADRRAGICEALGGISHADSIPTLIEQLRKETEAGVKIACIDALRTRKSAAGEIITALGEQLKSEFWQIVYSAAIALRDIASKDGIDPLIGALGGADGRLKLELNEVLILLTGVDKHCDPAAWRSWWDTNKVAVCAGTYQPLPDEKPGVRADGTMSTTFYGVPIKSKSIIFVLDISGSMIWESEWTPPKNPEKDPPPSVPTGGNSPPPAPAEKLDRPESTKKIDILKWQLKRCLAKLVEGTDFNLVVFGSAVRHLSDKMVKMNDGTRKMALAFVGNLSPEGATNSFDAIEKAFALAGTGEQKEKVSKASADTIYFLSDGVPTAGQIVSTKEILAKVQDLNRVKKIIIHTIGCFSSNPPVQIQANEKELGEKFLTELAKQNGGEFLNASNTK